MEVLGGTAITPSGSRFAVNKEMPGGWFVTNWSERHVAWACGLGTFGLNGLMITPKGCAVYLGSLVCDVTLKPTPNAYSSHTANCLFYRDSSCRRCLERCPAGAISEEGRSNLKCRSNLQGQQAVKLKELGLDRDLIGPAPACGLCSTGVPCEDRIPAGV